MSVWGLQELILVPFQNYPLQRSVTEWVSSLSTYSYLLLRIYPAIQRMKTAAMSFPRMQGQHETSCLVGLIGQWGISLQLREITEKKSLGCASESNTPKIVYKLLHFLFFSPLNKIFHLMFITSKIQKSKIMIVFVLLFEFFPIHLSWVLGEHTKIPYIPNNSMTMTPVAFCIILTLLPYKYTKPAQNRFSLYPLACLDSWLIEY